MLPGGAPFQARQDALRERLAARLAGMLVAHPPNLRYLCGFSGSNGLLLLRPGRALLFTDGRYREQAAREVVAARTLVPANGDLWAAAARHAAGLPRLGLEYDHVTLSQRERLARAYPGGLRPATGWIEALRRVKDAGEIAALRRAVALASSVFPGLLRQLRPGVAETAFAGELEWALRRAGGEGLAFETIIASGARGAWVHGHPGAEPIARRGFVVIDYGVILGGYVSDMTRSVHVGPAGRRARQIYGVVREAQAAAIAAVRPGVACATVDRAAREVIRRAGLGGFFPHSTGHGVGLEIHEAPRLGSTSKEVLAAGEVITIEPGVYIPGWGGVRIEDVVLVTGDGAEVLTPTPKELVVLA